MEKKRNEQPKPTAALEKIKKWVSPGSTAGILRDQEKRRQEALKKAGA